MIRERLKRTEVKQEYVNKPVTRVEESDKDNIDWQTLQQIITNAVDEVIGKTERAERNEWYDDECKEATKQKNKAYRRMIQKYYTRGAEEQYNEMRRIEKRMLKRKKRSFYEEQIKQVEKISIYKRTVGDSTS
jgi:hypothetical protein